MTREVSGQYDIEYARCNCFWGVRPGKYVTFLLDKLQSGTILDLGAGEGKNAIALAEKGFNITAVECSRYAINNFVHRLRTLDESVQNRIKIVQADVASFTPSEQFNAVIAYGIFHCLDSSKTIRTVVGLMKDSTIPNGYNVIATFVRGLPVPEVQDYLSPTLLPYGEFIQMYADWQIEMSENDILTESHPTSRIEHQHSICRILSRRPPDA